jgi:hypothetical protein
LAASVKSHKGTGRGEDEQSPAGFEYKEER